MTDLPGSDQTLLERLNALKPSTANLSPSSKSVAASTIEHAKPLSKEDALSERLKSLRNQPDNRTHITSGLEISHKGEEVITSPSPKPPSQPHSRPESSGAGADATQSLSTTENANGDEDPLLYTDDQTLEELLADLESDQQWVEEVLAEDEHRRVTALLQELGDAANTSEDPESNLESRKSRDKYEDDESSSSDDDSDGERMTREADEILAQTIDEVEHDKANKVPSQTDSTTASPSRTVKPSTKGDEAADERANTLGPNKSEPFSLPAAPSDFQDQHPSDRAEAEAEVAQDDADFAASISSRMAALKVNTPDGDSDGPDLPSVPADIDPLGLPSAPTFAPADRPAPGLIKRFGFTDEDQKTWCVVCLEDGAIRCLDCDGDIYCARCWKETHVGPSAGYDERGHRWEKFVKR
ncbi:hypothetical protein F4774DRAFT_401318 [Daldinia eschscholtzii]|nr:hypothetical protein F4774DRAFT_401318 [Daldinia eschscholtzii]